MKITAKLLACALVAPIAVLANLPSDSDSDHHSNSTTPILASHGNRVSKTDILLNGIEVVPPNMTAAEAAAWVKAAEYQLFEKPITRNEYDRRNWMWVRCRCHHEAHFDMGGTWFGHRGEALRKILKRQCPLTSWKFKYVNGLGWGDAMVNFHWWGDDCRLRDVVNIMRNLALRGGRKARRDFYMWDCPTFEDDAHYGTEREGMIWPGYNQASDGPVKGTKVQGSLNQPFERPQGWGVGNGKEDVRG